MTRDGLHPMHSEERNNLVTLPATTVCIALVSCCTAAFISYMFQQLASKSLLPVPFNDNHLTSIYETFWHDGTGKPEQMSG